MIDHSNEKLQLKFEPGLCSLKQFQDNFLSKDNKNYNKSDHIQNLKYIFKFGVETVLELDKHAMHLSDHKPDNFVICYKGES